MLGVEAPPDPINMMPSASSGLELQDGDPFVRVSGASRFTGSPRGKTQDNDRSRASWYRVLYC